MDTKLRPRTWEVFVVFWTLSVLIANTHLLAPKPSELAVGIIAALSAFTLVLLLWSLMRLSYDRITTQKTLIEACFVLKEVLVQDDIDKLCLQLAQRSRRAKRQERNQSLHAIEIKEWHEIIQGLQNRFLIIQDIATNSGLETHVSLEDYLDPETEEEAA